MKLTIRNVTDELLKIERCKCGHGVTLFFFVYLNDEYVPYLGCDYCGEYVPFHTWLLGIEGITACNKDD